MLAILPVLATEAILPESSMPENPEELLDALDTMLQTSTLSTEGENSYFTILYEQRDGISSSKYLEYVSDESHSTDARVITLELLKDSSSLNEQTSEQLKADLRNETNPDVSQHILMTAQFDQPEDSALLKEMIQNKDPDTAAMSLRVLTHNDPDQAMDIADGLLANKNTSPILFRQAIHSMASALEDSNKEAKLEYINRCKEILSETSDSTTVDAVASSLASLHDIDAICAVLESEQIDDIMKTYTLGQNEEYLSELDYSLLTEEYKAVLSQSMSIYPIEDVCNRLGIETPVLVEPRATNFTGFVVYRDGVEIPFNENDWHAALMNRENSSGSDAVIHIPHDREFVQKASWNSFIGVDKNGNPVNNFMCVYRQKSNPTLSQRNLVVGMARTLLSQKTGYSIFGPVAFYNDLTYGKIEPSDVIGVRCDGVVEYCYEYYGHPVFGGSSNWDVSLAQNKQAHAWPALSPIVQAKYLTKVQSYAP